MGHSFPAYATRQRFSFMVTTIIILIHLLACLSIFTFTWQGFTAFCVLYVFSAMGITFCFHRMLSHRSFKAVPILRYFAIFCGIIALQGGPIRWSATHRIHHAKSDKPGDPHSPKLSGFLWSHIIWNFFRNPEVETEEQLQRLTQDLYDDKGIVFMEKHFTGINLLFALSLFVIGYLMGGWAVGVSVLVWGGFLRIVAMWHITWCINSATHIWGYKNYETPDDSKNLWWLTVLSMGEGWHNNHHRFQRPAQTGHRWFEIDLTYLLIMFLNAIGLVYKVVPLVIPAGQEPSSKKGAKQASVSTKVALS